MPWKESDVMSERTKFIARLLDGERMTDLCREFEISRKTGYKLVERFTKAGPEGLLDRSRRPKTNPHRTPGSVVSRVVKLRRQYPTWGPKKLRSRLETLDQEVRWPAASTIGVILKDAGLVDGRKRRRRVWPTPPSDRTDSQGPNELWCMDFKGQFRLSNRQYCYPLTVTDHFSRYLLGCEALTSTRTDPTAAALELIFREYGLPSRLRSDNGTPFASVGLAGLSRLAVWLMRLGIKLERIDPGHPEQNGRHERMHLTLKQETTRPGAENMLLQQARFDDFREQFNGIRPHEALQMQTPSSVHEQSKRRLPRQLPPLVYPLHDLQRPVGSNGCIKLNRRNFFVGAAFVGQDLGLRQLEPHTWLLSFMDYDLGYLDLEQGAVVALPPEHQNATA